MARIDDLLYVDDLTKHSDQFSSISRVGMISHKGAQITYSVPIPSTPYKTAFTTPNYSPAQLVSPATRERSPFVTSGKIPQRGLGVKKVLTDYLSIDTKANDNHIAIEKPDLTSNIVHELPACQTGHESLGCAKTEISPPKPDSVSEKHAIKE